MPGVLRVFTAADIPGERLTGLIVADWPLMIAAGETGRSGADVLAGVVAASEAAARAAAGAIRVDYEVLEPLTDVLQAEQQPRPRPRRGQPAGDLRHPPRRRRRRDTRRVGLHRLGRFPHPDDRARLPGDRGRGRPARGGRRAPLFAGAGGLRGPAPGGVAAGPARGKGAGHPGGQRRRLRRQGGHHRAGPCRPVRPAAAASRCACA